MPKQPKPSVKGADIRVRVIGNSTSHSLPIGSVQPLYKDVYLGSGQFLRPTDIELVLDEMVEVEDPNVLKIKQLRAQAEILAKVDCKGLDESKISRLVKFKIEMHNQKMNGKLAMKAIRVLADVLR